VWSSTSFPGIRRRVAGKPVIEVSKRYTTFIFKGIEVGKNKMLHVNHF